MSETNSFRDGYLDRFTDFGSISSTTQLLADDQSIVQEQGQGVLLLTSDDTTAANRTFTIANGNVTGQRLTIVLTSATAAACQLANSGNVKLSAAWAPATQYSNITLMWLTGAGVWVEVSRVTGA